MPAFHTLHESDSNEGFGAGTTLAKVNDKHGYHSCMLFWKGLVAIIFSDQATWFKFNSCKKNFSSTNQSECLKMKG